MSLLTFHPFSELPTEIRLKIWVFALLTAVPEASGHRRILDMVELGRYPIQTIETPPLILACHEVKREWDRILRKYPLFCRELPKSRCNPSVDILRWATLDILGQTLSFDEDSLGLGFCLGYCEGRRRLKRVIIQPVDMLGDVLDSQFGDRRRVTNSMGIVIGFRRTWRDTSAAVRRLHLDELQVPQLRDVWFEGLDPFGLHWNSKVSLPSLDAASFTVDGASLVTYPSYLFRYWAKSDKVEVALLSQAKAKQQAAGELWADRKRNFLAADAFDGAICRIRIVRGSEDDGEEKSLEWKEIRRRAEGEGRAMIWHRVVWNGIAQQFDYWLGSSHGDESRIGVIPLPHELA